MAICMVPSSGTTCPIHLTFSTSRCNSDRYVQKGVPAGTTKFCKACTTAAGIALLRPRHRVLITYYCRTFGREWPSSCNLPPCLKAAERRAQRQRLEAHRAKEASARVRQARQAEENSAKADAERIARRAAKAGPRKPYGNAVSGRLPAGAR